MADATCVMSRGRKIPENGSRADIEGVGDLACRESPVPQFERSRRVRFGGSLCPALIDAAFFRNSNASGLPLLAIFEFDFGKAKQHAGDHSAYGPTKVDELRDRYDPNATVTPVRENTNSVELPPRDPVELPNDDSLDRPSEDRFLQSIECGTLQGLPRLLVLEPLDAARLDPIASKSATDFGSLTIVLLAT